MIGGPLDPLNIAKHAPDFTPAGARFVIKCCIERGVKLDGDTVQLLIEIGKRDKPEWEAPTREQMIRERMASRGIQVPEARQDPSTLVEAKEIDQIPKDEGEEQEL